MNLLELRRLLVQRSGNYSLVADLAGEPDYFVDNGADQIINESRLALADRAHRMFPLEHYDTSVVQGQIEVPVPYLKEVEFVRLSKSDGSLDIDDGKLTRRHMQYLVDTYGIPLADQDQDRPLDYCPASMTPDFTGTVVLLSEPFDDIGTWSVEVGTATLAVGGNKLHVTAVPDGDTSFVMCDLDISAEYLGHFLEVQLWAELVSGAMTLYGVWVDQAGSIQFTQEIAIGSNPSYLTFPIELLREAFEPYMPIVRIGFGINTNPGADGAVDISSLSVRIVDTPLETQVIDMAAAWCDFDGAPTVFPSWMYRGFVWPWNIALPLGSAAPPRYAVPPATDEYNGALGYITSLDAIYISPGDTKVLYMDVVVTAGTLFYYRQSTGERVDVTTTGAVNDALYVYPTSQILGGLEQVFTLFASPDFVGSVREMAITYRHVSSASSFDESQGSGIVVMPPPDDAYNVSVFGKFLPKPMVNPGDRDWLSENYPHLIINEALARLETAQRNTEGRKDFDEAVQIDINRHTAVIETARLGEGPASNWVMEEPI